MPDSVTEKDLQETMDKIEGSLAASDVQVFRVNSTNFDQSVMFEQAADFIKFSSTGESPVFKEITIPQKKEISIDSSMVLARLGVFYSNQLPQSVIKQIDQFNENFRQVQWDAPTAVDFSTIRGNVDYHFVMRTEDFYRTQQNVDSFLNDLANQIQRMPTSEDPQFNQTIDSQIKTDKLIDKFVASAKDDPRFALTTSDPERRKFIRSKIDEDKQLRDIYNKMHKSLPFVNDVLSSISSSLLTEYRNHKSHYEAIRKEQQSK